MHSSFSLSDNTLSLDEHEHEHKGQDLAVPVETDNRDGPDSPHARA